MAPLATTAKHGHAAEKLANPHHDPLQRLRLRLIIFCAVCLVLYTYLHQVAASINNTTSSREGEDRGLLPTTRTVRVIHKERSTTVLLSPTNQDAIATSTVSNTNHNNNHRRIRIPLHQLVQPSHPYQCVTNHTHPVQQIHNAQAEGNNDRKIPKIVHQTGKSGCLPSGFLNNTQAWSFANHSYYFHDDEAVDKLLFQQGWPEFPQLQNAVYCMQQHGGGAMKADIWRYLVLWEYGGIYVDLDTAPGSRMNAATIPADVDAFLIPERAGILSQYFLAISPRHPLMFLAIQDALRELHDTDDTRNLDVPAMTGPRCIKRAFLRFRGVPYHEMERKIGDRYHTNKKPTEGIYYSHPQFAGNRSVTVVGAPETTRQWIWRDFIHGRRKNSGWKEMNMTDYKTLDRTANNRSCGMELFNKYYLSAGEEEESTAT